MTESTPHAEDPAEGTDQTETGTPHDGAARTPHAEEPAEGEDTAARTAAGTDPENRISGA